MKNHLQVGSSNNSHDSTNEYREMGLGIAEGEKVLTMSVEHQGQTGCQSNWPMFPFKCEACFKDAWKN